MFNVQSLVGLLTTELLMVFTELRHATAMRQMDGLMFRALASTMNVTRLANKAQKNVGCQMLGIQ